MAIIRKIGVTVLVVVLAVILGLSGWLGCRVANYTNRGFEIGDAFAWAWNDAKYYAGIRTTTEEGPVPEWFDGVINDHITEWNWENFYK